MVFKKDEIDKLTAEDICIKILDHTISMYSTYTDESQQQILDRMNEVEKAVHLILTFEFEYYNGGLLQYFMNSSGELANETVEIHRFLGANRTADIIEKAMKVLNKYEVPPDVLNTKLQNAGRLHDIIYHSDIYDNPDFDKDFGVVEKELHGFYPIDEKGDICELLENYVNSMRERITE